MAKARILLFDIESSPNLGWVWGKWEQNVISFETEWHILSVAWKWLGESQIHVVALNDFPKTFAKDPTNDYHVVQKIHELFNEADVVVGHNSNSFDNKKAQGRMLVHGFDPPSPYHEVDTLRQAKRHFSFNSYRLGDLATSLGVGAKADTGGFQTWLGCMNGDESCWKIMKKYNKQDVKILEAVYLRLRPWMNGHPNIAFLEDELDGCPNCGKDTLINQGLRKTRTMTYQRVQCSTAQGGCGTWSRKRIAERNQPKPNYTN